jgi:phage baseplate assembly protein V
MRDRSATLGPVATRGFVTAARVRGGRVICDLTLLSGETRSRVELLQPMGWTMVPKPGAEVLVLEVGGLRGHLVALVADDAGLRVTDAEPGQIAVRDERGQRVVFRDDGIEITGALKVTITASGPVVLDAPEIRLGSAGASQPLRLANNAASTKVFAE